MNVGVCDDGAGGEMASLTSGETRCNFMSFSDRQMESVMRNSKY